MHHSIEKLLGVQKFDREISLLEEAKIRRPMELSDDLRKVNAGKASVSAVEEVIKTCRMDIDKGELQIKELDGEIEKSKIAMNGSTTNEAFAICKGQIEKHEESQGTLEENVLELMSYLDTLQGKKEEAERELADIEKAYQRKESEVNGLVSGLESRIGGLKEERGELSVDIDGDHLDIYERIRSKVEADSVVPVHKKDEAEGVFFCQGCYMRVTKQELTQLSLAQELLTCRSCSRLLYLED